MIRALVQGHLLFMIRAYQALLSPLFYGSCRFHPSCSHYAAEAVEAHGPVKGAWLALGRLLRCQPFCRGGFDPVPEEFSILHRNPHARHLQPETHKMT
jgi:putative membrane protein insertion efficiency factor